MGKKRFEGEWKIIYPHKSVTIPCFYPHKIVTLP